MKLLLLVFSWIGWVLFGGCREAHGQSVEHYVSAEKHLACRRAVLAYPHQQTPCPLGTSVPQWAPTTQGPRQVLVAFSLYLHPMGRVERVELLGSTFHYADPSGQRITVPSAPSSFWWSYQECLRQKLAQLPHVEPVRLNGEAHKTKVSFTVSLSL